MTTEAKAIEVTGLRKSFGRTQVLNGVFLEVSRGSVTALLGPNGAGKTTTIKALLGLVRPDEGSIRVLGMEPQRHMLKIKERVGYLPEDRAFPSSLSVKGTLDLFRGLSGRWDEELVEEMVDSFELPLDRRTVDLSKGMASQLALTLALAPRPDLLILDEPTSGLDPVLQQEFISSIMGEVADRGQTVLLSTHNLAEVERIADAVVLIREGQTVLTGSLDDLSIREKRVRVVFQRGVPPEISAHPSVVGISPEGRAHLFTVSGDVDEFVAILRKYRPFALEVMDMRLEEIFITHARSKEERT